MREEDKGESVEGGRVAGNGRRVAGGGGGGGGGGGSDEEEQFRSCRLQ